MGRISAWTLIGILTVSGGCATSGEMVIDVHAPSEQTRASIGDWSRLRRLSSGAEVLVDVDESDLRFGKVSSISDAEPHADGRAADSTRIDQSRQACAVPQQAGAGKGAAIGVGLGVLALVATGGVFWQPMIGYPLIGAGIGSGSAIGVTRQTVVYQRR